jgi:hypothetical protein
MPITTLSALKQKSMTIPSFVTKTPTVFEANLLYSLWKAPGYPAPGANPSSGVAGDVPTMATVGAIPFPNKATNLLSSVVFSAERLTTIFLYDRLLHNSGVSHTQTSVQTLNTVALTRPDANGEGVEAWWEIYGSMNTGTPTVTLSYTNQDGTSGRSASSGAFAASQVATRTGPFTLNSGDTGVRSVQTWQNSASFGTGGGRIIGLVLRRRIATFTIKSEGRQTFFDFLMTGLPSIPTDACLELIFSNEEGVATTVFGQFSCVET